MSERLHFAGLLILFVLAAILLGLIGWTFYIVGQHIGPDGRVPSAEAFGLTALLLSFREVIASIRGIWDTNSRDNLANKLADSAPGGEVPKDAAAAARQTADAADAQAHKIEGGV